MRRLHLDLTESQATALLDVVSGWLEDAEADAPDEILHAMAGKLAALRSIRDRTEAFVAVPCPCPAGKHEVFG